MRKLDILVLDGNNEDYLLLESYLEALEDYSTSSTHVLDFHSALLELAAKKFDVVLMDPAFCEAEYTSRTIQKLMRLHPHICLIIVTENAKKGLGKESLKLGAQDYLIKTEIDADSLNKAIFLALNRLETLGNLCDQRKQIQKMIMAVENSQNAIAITNQKYEVEYANQSFLKLINYSLEEVLDDGIHKLFRLFSDSQIGNTFLVKSAESGIKKEAEILDENGCSYWMSIIAEPIVACEGNLSGYIFTIEDVTEKKNSEWKVEESQAKLQAILDSFEDVVFTIDGDGRYKEIFGDLGNKLPINLSHYIGKKASGLWGEVHSQELEKALQIVGQGNSTEYEWSLPVDQRVYYFQTKLSPLKQGNEIIGALGIARDITEIKETVSLLKTQQMELVEREKELASIVKTIPNPFFYKGPNGKYRIVNSAFANFFGKSIEDIVGKTTKELLPPKYQRKIIAQTDGDILSGKVRTTSYETVLKNRKDEEKSLKIFKGPIYGEQNRINGIVGVVTDITSQNKREKDLVAVKTRIETLAKIGFDLNKINSEQELLIYIGTKLNSIGNYQSGIILGKLTTDLKCFSVEYTGNLKRPIWDALQLVKKEFKGNCIPISPGFLEKINAKPISNLVDGQINIVDHEVFQPLLIDAIFKNKYEEVYALPIKAFEKMYGFVLIIAKASELNLYKDLITGLSSQITPVLERITVQSQLRDRQMELSRALDAANMGIWKYSSEKKQIEFGSRALKVVRKFKKSGISLNQFLQHVSEEDEAALKDLLCNANKKPHFDHSFRFKLSETSVRWLRITATSSYSEDSPFELIGVIRDVTPEFEYQEKITSLNQQMSNALKGSKSGIFQYSPDSKRLMLDDTSARFLHDRGKQIKSLEGLQEVILSEDWEKLDSVIHQNKDGATFELTLRVKNNEKPRYIKISGYHFKTNLDQSMIVTGIMQDVSQQKRREVQAQENRSYLQFLTETGSQFAMLETTAEVVNYFSHKLGELISKGLTIVSVYKQDLSQYEIKAVAGSQLLIDSLKNSFGHDLVGRTNPSNPEVVAKLQENTFLDMTEDLSLLRGFSAENFDKIFSSTAIHAYKLIPIFRDGSLFATVGFLIDSEATLSKEPLIKAFISQLTPVLERTRATEQLRESESKYRELVEASPAALYHFDPSHGKVYRSKKISNIIGYSEQDLEVNPHLYNERIHPEDEQMIQDAMEDYNAGLDFDIEYRILHRDGGWRWVRDLSLSRNRKYDGIIRGLILDITREKELTLLLEREQNLLEETQRVGRFGTWTYNVNTGESWWSDSLYEILGQPYEKMEMPLSEVEEINQEDRHAIRAALARSEEDFSFTRTIKLDLGPEIRYVYLASKLDKDQGSSDLIHIGFVQDITEEVLLNEQNNRQQQELVASQDQLYMATSGAKLGILDWNLSTNNIYYNESFYSIFEIENKDLIVEPEKLFKDYVYEDHAEITDILLSKLFEGLVENVDEDFRIVTERSSIKWVNLKGTVYKNTTQKPNRFLAVISDITELKELEIRLKEQNIRLDNLINSVPGVVFNCYGDKHYSMIFASPFIETLTGYESAEFYPNGNTKFADLIHPKDRKLVREKIETAFKSRTLYEVSYRIIRKDGTIRWVVQTAGFSYYETDLSYTEIDGVILDISDRVEAEDNVLKAALEASDKERKRIAQDIHDGIQQLLVAALLNFQSLKKEKGLLSDKMAHRFENGYKFLNDGISETRAIARKLMPKAIEDFGLVNAINELLTFLPSEVCVKFEENLDGHRLNENQEIGLYRITQEAINNILKYAEADTVLIALRKEGDSIRLKVSDNGTGFDKRKINSISSGYGISSMISRTNALGGTLTINSEPGKGTTVIADISNT